MNFELSEEQQAFQEAARSFAKGEMAPYAAEWDQKKIFPRPTIAKAGDMGFCGIYAREGMDGMGLSRLDASIILEELAAACPSTAAYISIHNMVTWILDQYGGEALKAKFGPALSSGSLLGSYCLTEPGSGSDAAALRTTATLKGDRYILRGSKAFVSGGGESDILVVMARTGDASARGISSFLVPSQLKGLSFGENERKMGWNSQPTRMISFDDVEVPKDHLLGQEGEGFKIAMKALDGGRLNIATCSVGAAQAALDQARQYMHEREQFGKPLASFQALQFKVADMATHLVAARQMIRLAAVKLDEKDPMATTYCAMAKRFATDKGFEICNDALQIFGGYGYTQEYPLERYLRDARVHQILEGTNEIMRVIISRQVLDVDRGALIR